MNEIEKVPRWKIEISDNFEVALTVWDSIMENGIEISKTTPNRLSIMPGQIVPDDVCEEIHKAISAFHTPEVIADYQQYIQSLKGE